MRILVVEDDLPLGTAIKAGLENASHTVDWATDGQEGQQAAVTTTYDVILLDLGLPKKSGIELLKGVRGKGIKIPVIILTAMDSIEDRVKGLDAGADDYVVKPFSMTELFARIRAVLRRIRPGLAEDVITAGDITMDRVAHRVKRSDREIHLGPTEFRLLDYLMQHPGRVFSREQLLDAVWGSDVYVEARTVDVHVGRLRKALNTKEERDPIRTVRSAGPWTAATRGAHVLQCIQL